MSVEKLEDAGSACGGQDGTEGLGGTAGASGVVHAVEPDLWLLEQHHVEGLPDKAIGRSGVCRWERAAQRGQDGAAGGVQVGCLGQAPGIVGSALLHHALGALPAGFGFVFVRIARRRDADARPARGGDAVASGLEHMGGFVGEQLCALGGVDVRGLSQEDVAARGEGSGLDRPRQFAGLGAFVEADIAGIAAVDRCEEGPLARCQVPPGAGLLDALLEVWAVCTSAGW